MFSDVFPYKRYKKINKQTISNYIFLHSERNHTTINNQQQQQKPIEWAKLFANDKELIYKISKKFIQLNTSPQKISI